MKTILLGVTGGIAAYKSAMIASLLNQSKFNVITIMTKNATEFITPLTFEVLTKNPVIVDTFQRQKAWEVEHISWSKKADLFLVAPATANFIGKYANGLADDMLTTTALAFTCPVVIAPAMNENMYINPIVQNNLDKLKGLNVSFIGPEKGYLAEGISALGRMAEPIEIVEFVKKILA